MNQTLFSAVASTKILDRTYKKVAPEECSEAQTCLLAEERQAFKKELNKHTDIFDGKLKYLNKAKSETNTQATISSAFSVEVSTRILDDANWCLAYEEKDRSSTQDGTATESSEHS